MIEENMNLVYFVLNKYYSQTPKDEDMVQCGMLGLVKAANYWDESKGAFSTYAVKCIRNEISREVTDRMKHVGVLSLEQECPYDDELVLMDSLGVEDDISLLENPLYDSLTDEEQFIVRYIERGYTPAEVADVLHFPLSRIYKRLRSIKLKWRRKEDEDDEVSLLYRNFWKPNSNE